MFFGIHKTGSCDKKRVRKDDSRYRTHCRRSGRHLHWVWTAHNSAVSCSLCACGQITGSELNKEDSYPLSNCGLVAANFLSYVFFWIIPRRLNFIWRRFGTLCLFHLHRRVGLDRVFQNVSI